MIRSRDRILPDQRLLRHERPEVADDRSHVTVCELEPCAGKRVRQLVGMLVEAPRNLLVGRVKAQREIGGEHGRHTLLRGVKRVRHYRLGAFRLPLPRSRRTLRQLPFVFEQVLEEVVAPLRRSLRPDDLRAAGDRVRPEAPAMLALPPEALILNGAGFRLRTHEGRIARAVGFAEGVAAGNQRDGLLVVHCHTEEGLADVARRRDRIGLAVWPFRIDVNEAHLHRAERLRKLALAAVALVAQPRTLGTPKQFFGLPHIAAATRKTERLEAHRLKRDIAGENHQVSPRDLAAVLPLDRPQQPTRLVEIGVVRPTIERCEALLTGTGAAAAVGDTVCARAVPRHADHEPAVMAEVGGPPRLEFRCRIWMSTWFGHQSRLVRPWGLPATGHLPALLSSVFASMFFSYCCDFFVVIF